MKSSFAIILISLALAGCECFLPGGKAPEGAIVTNPAGAAAILVLDRRAALDYFINELVRETMLHGYGQEIFIDADRASGNAAAYIVERTGELSGIKRGFHAGTNSLRLISRNIGRDQWQMELISNSGKSLWKRQITVKAN